MVDEQKLRNALKACLPQSEFPPERRQAVLRAIRKEEPIVKRKISTALVFAIVMTLIVGGAVLYAAGMGLFLSPNHLAPGGVTGIAVILNSAFGLPTGITAFVLNIPLFLIAIKAFGFRFFSATLAATTLASLLIDVFDALPVATNDLLLAAFAGGAMNAVGISLIFKAGATTGGTDIIVKLIRKRYPHIRTGRAYLYTDVVILLAAGIVLSDPVGQAAQVAVVNEEVRFHLAREAVMGSILFGIVPVDGIKLHAPFPAPFHGLVQQLSFTYGPQYQAVAVFDQHLQRIGGKRDFVPYFRVTVLYDCAVKINGDSHDAYVLL